MINKKRDDKLTQRELPEALYEGLPHVSNLAEKLARQHGQAGALSFFDMMGPTVQSFWIDIAGQLIEHSKHWLPNNGSACVLDEKELLRIQRMDKLSTLTYCAYCGKSFPAADSDSTEISQHIKTCEKHPLPKALKQIELLSGLLEKSLTELSEHFGDYIDSEDIAKLFDDIEKALKERTDHGND